MYGMGGYNMYIVTAKLLPKSIIGIFEIHHEIYTQHVRGEVQHKALFWFVE